MDVLAAALLNLRVHAQTELYENIELTLLLAVGQRKRRGGMQKGRAG